MRTEISLVVHGHLHPQMLRGRSSQRRILDDSGVGLLDSRMKEVVRSLPGLAGGWASTTLAIFGEKYAASHQYTGDLGATVITEPQRCSVAGGEP